ncbi:MAG: signal peptidase I [Smithella sp.]|jgi:signal peptidase I
MTNKKRNPFLAVALSICVTGLGQMYNGQLFKAIIFCLFNCLITLFFATTHLLHSFKGFEVYLSIEICWSLFVISDSLYVSIKLKEIKLKSYNKLYFYILFSLVSALLYGAIEYGIVYNIVGLHDIHIPALTSMKPTLVAGDYVYTDTKHYKTNNPQKNDIIVFKNPKDRSASLISRIIATEGDSIEIKSKKVFINGKEYPDTYSVHNDPFIFSTAEYPRDNFGPEIISQGKIFVMGDNREMSLDSRFLGQLDKNDIVSKVLYIYWSWDAVRWRRIGTEFK